jgi:hypothetical protein
VVSALLSPARLGALAACAAALAGCGSAVKPKSPVHLQVSSPSDGTQVHTGSTTVSGTVTPAGATVLVLGRGVRVSHGSFSTQVSLAPGTNIVDVLAGAPHAAAAMSAVRVVRIVYIPIPDLSGDSPSDAQAQLSALGLVPKINNDDGFFSSLLPVSDAVCQTKPPAGAKVPPHSTVTVTVSKTC